MDKPKKDTKKTQDEFEKLQKKCDEYLAGWQRAKADFINHKREQEKKKKETIEFANAALLVQLLPIYDNFKKALAHIPKDSRETDWVKGMENIFKQQKEFFKMLGIEEIKTVGEKFDPTLHEAVETKKVAGKKPQEIIEEVAPGYTLHGQVVNPAKVIVNE